ncbi:MAG: polyisoprenoid-binding protein YceI [Gammaproteobacteria bacterium]|jgi:polyisoprenoid-binding protein YceI
MKNLILFIALTLISTVSYAQGAATRSTVKANESVVNWTGKKVTGEHSGTIQIKSGLLGFDKDGMLTQGEVTMDMSTIVCTDLEGESKGKLEGHLSSEDFFGTEKFPSAKLVFTEVKKGEGEMLMINGEITIKDITESISFEVEMKDGMAIADIVIDRTKFGVKYGSGSFFEDLGDKTIYDDFDLKVQMAY